MANLGEFCKSVGITESSLINRNLPHIGHICNGLALELKCYADDKHLTIKEFVEILALLDSSFTSVVNPSAVSSKVNTVKDNKRKLTSKKKVKGIKNVKELLEKQFCCPVQRDIKHLNVSYETVNYNKYEQKSDGPTPIDALIGTKSTAVQTDNDDHKNDLKQLNVLKYKISIRGQKLDELENKLSERQDEFKNLTSAKGHYSVKNVKKRDETARKNLHLLRDSQRLVLSQAKRLRAEKEIIRNSELQEIKNSNMKDKIEILCERVEIEKNKKVALQKANSYYKSEITRLRTLCDRFDRNQSVESKDFDNDCDFKKLKLQLDEKETIIYELEDQLDELQNVSIQMKNEKGYTDNIRLCIIELAGLEVATAKMSSVIQTVSKHVFEKQFSVSNLPNATTCQRIIDEGQFVAKAFIADKLESSANWGLGRDGTSRRKHKIVDTSVTLDTGDVISLGFTRIASENADTIQKVTEDHLTELSSFKSKPTFLHDTLAKLAFTMSDRASNEKCANKRLDQWLQCMLNGYDGETTEVHHFHCMAHVLLGFHNYVRPKLSEFEQKLKERNGPYGRDTLPVFNSWMKNESVACRVVRTTSNVFGPVGEHLGVRDRWEAYCKKHGLKSIIGNYKDNRFNSLFQTSAEIFLHRNDFITVLNTVSKPNLKLKAVLSELQSSNVCTLLQGLGLFYLKLTGPYWNLLTCGKVPYNSLYTHVTDIVNFLNECVNNPEHILQTEQHWSPTDPLELQNIPNKDLLAHALFCVTEDSREILCEVVRVIADAMLLCIKKQLVDFLPDGKFHTMSPINSKTINFAPLTNLACEHHFGDLDSSQKRRPNASYHHHSSVQLLKRNRKPIMNWLDEMDSSERSHLLEAARTGGKDLRERHKKGEENVIDIINCNMLNENCSTKRRKQNPNPQPSKKQKNNNQTANVLSLKLKENCYAAVAYQDTWYPGFVESVQDEKTCVIKFMTPCRKAGLYQWPVREDRQVVDSKFILSQDLMPECHSSGRQWLIPGHETISKLYLQFHAEFFI